MYIYIYFIMLIRCLSSVNKHNCKDNQSKY
uniref:Uncharacterized protein n=1 Tax=viral metagenome TaxID=1070528 RepID=A0A6C0ED02_9ZZZZ